MLNFVVWSSLNCFILELAKKLSVFGFWQFSRSNWKGKLMNFLKRDCQEIIFLQKVTNISFLCRNKKYRLLFQWKTDFFSFCFYYYPKYIFFQKIKRFNKRFFSFSLTFKLLPTKPSLRNRVYSQYFIAKCEWWQNLLYLSSFWNPK